MPTKRTRKVVGKNTKIDCFVKTAQVYTETEIARVWKHIVREGMSAVTKNKEDPFSQEMVKTMRLLAVRTTAMEATG